jgi:dihydrofolate reductase
MRTNVYVGTSLDGFIAGTDGDIRWLVKYEDSARDDYAEFMTNIDAIVIGRGTYDSILGFPSWPYEKRVFVLSTTLKQVPDSLLDKAKVISMQPKAVLEYLTNEGISNVYVDGGKVIQSFLRDDCVDDITITVAPVLLGHGIPLFGSLEKDLHFDHVGTKVFSNGLVKSHYQRKRS